MDFWQNEYDLVIQTIKKNAFTACRMEAFLIYLARLTENSLHTREDFDVRKEKSCGKKEGQQGNSKEESCSKKEDSHKKEGCCNNKKEGPCKKSNHEEAYFEEARRQKSTCPCRRKRYAGI